MGQISGVDAALITNIAGVAVANISYVGPTSAATIGLGGGGGPIRIFAPNFWAAALEACTNGQKAIDKSGPMTLYQQGDFFYYDAELTLPFNGNGNWWWCQTVNFSYQINTEGGIMTSQNCGGDPGLVFTVYGIQGEEGFSESCGDGQNNINKNGSQVLYQNGEMFYVDAEYTTPFNGNYAWWWCQTNNTSYMIAGEGNMVMNHSCG